MPTKLGQNFLEDKTIVEKIVEAADLKPSDFVIEIGPGKGILTEKLSKRAKKVIAIEIDERLVDYLKRKFKNAPNIEIIHADILKINLSKLATSYKLQTTNYKLIANIPYYITSKIIRLFLEAECPPREMILMVQKEVAERIAAPPGKMSILSVSVRYYAKPKILFYVNKESFNPIPKVDSAVIRITYNQQLSTNNKENKNLPLWKRGKASEAKQGDLKVSKKDKLFKENENKKFFKIVRAGFCAKRKTLTNNLSNSLQLGKKEVQEKLKAAGISPTVRAQELSIKDWKKLSSLI